MKDKNGFVLGMIVVPLTLVGIGVTYASSVVTPNLFVAGTTAVAAEVNANFAAHAAAINDNDSRITTLEGAGPVNHTMSSSLNISSVTANSSYQKIADVLTFTKQRSGSTIEVILNSRLSVGGFAGGASGVHFQLRVDNAVGTLSQTAAVTSSSTHQFSSMLAVFEGLAAGNHTVSVWTRTNAGTASSVLLDSGGWGGRVFSREID